MQGLVKELSLKCEDSEKIKNCLQLKPLQNLAGYCSVKIEDPDNMLRALLTVIISREIKFDDKTTLTDIVKKFKDKTHHTGFSDDEIKNTGLRLMLAIELYTIHKEKLKSPKELIEELESADKESEWYTNHKKLIQLKENELHTKWKKFYEEEWKDKYLTNVCSVNAKEIIN